MLLYLKDQCQAKYCLQLIWSSGAAQGGNGNPLQYPCLENPMVRGAWQVSVHGVTEVTYIILLHNKLDRRAKTISFYK